MICDVYIMYITCTCVCTYIVYCMCVGHTCNTNMYSTLEVHASKFFFNIQTFLNLEWNSFATLLVAVGNNRLASLMCTCENNHINGTKKLLYIVNVI